MSSCPNMYLPVILLISQLFKLNERTLQGGKAVTANVAWLLRLRKGVR